MPCAAVPPRKAASSRSARRARPGTGMRAGRPHRRQHGLGRVATLAARARDHHADGVEQMPPRVVAHLVGERVIAQLADERDDGLGRAGGGMQRVDGFGVGHAMSPDGSLTGHYTMSVTPASRTSASTATTPSPAGRTISGLISASATPASCASRDIATMACASASRSPLGLPR